MMMSETISGIFGSYRRAHDMKNKQHIHRLQRCNSVPPNTPILKKSPLVTQDQEYSRDSRLNSFQSGGLKGKKKKCQWAADFKQPTPLTPPRRNTSSLQYQELRLATAWERRLPCHPCPYSSVSEWHTGSFRGFRLSSVFLWLLQQFYQLALTASMSLTKFWAKHIPNIWKRQEFINLECQTTLFTQANSLGYAQLWYENKQQEVRKQINSKCWKKEEYQNTPVTPVSL